MHAWFTIIDKYFIPKLSKRYNSNIDIHSHINSQILLSTNNLITALQIVYPN